jgi:hypothetical protein
VDRGVIAGTELDKIYQLGDQAIGDGTKSAITKTLETGQVSTTYRVPLKLGSQHLLINE